jgi:hypothetical protein
MRKAVIGKTKGVSKNNSATHSQENDSQNITSKVYRKEEINTGNDQKRQAAIKVRKRG